MTHGRSEVVVAYGSTFMVSIALGALPALSSILTSPDFYDLGASLYGFLFVPQALAAMGVALWGASAATRMAPSRSCLPG